MGIRVKNKDGRITYGRVDLNKIYQIKKIIKRYFMSETNSIIVDPMSFSSFHITMYFNDTPLSVGTAFVYEHNAKNYMLTNWHNVTGKNPETLIHLSSNLSEPNKIGIMLYKGSTWEEMTIELFDENHSPVWVEHPKYKHLTDFVAIPIDIPNVYSWLAINKAIEEKDYIGNYSPSVGDEVFVLGFPFSQKAGGFLPIWKRASIASEPNIDINELPLLYKSSNIFLTYEYRKNSLNNEAHQVSYPYEYEEPP